jgi:hypothetical protein
LHQERYKFLAGQNFAEIQIWLDSAPHLDSYLTIEPKKATEEGRAGVKNDGWKTPKPLSRSWESHVVPKAGFEPAHPCGR